MDKFEEKYIITPKVGIDNIKFGMTRKEVRKLLTHTLLNSMKVSEFSSSEADYYDEFSLIFNYDNNDKLNFISSRKKESILQLDNKEVSPIGLTKSNTNKLANDFIKTTDGWISKNNLVSFIFYSPKVTAISCYTIDYAISQKLLI
jgi:hypothetical protein